MKSTQPVVAPRAGFTLIELLVAIAMMATLLAALLSFVFSITEIWGQGS